MTHWALGTVVKKCRLWVRGGCWEWGALGSRKEVGEGN